MNENLERSLKEAYGDRRNDFLLKRRKLLSIKCSCGKPGCEIAGLLSVPAHIAALVRAIFALGCADQICSSAHRQDPWPGVTYALSMAGGIGHVEADPSFADESDAGLMCSTAWDRDEEDRELASHYASAVIVFNFSWIAYEAAIEESLGDLQAKGKGPAHIRTVIGSEEELVNGIKGFAKLYRIARQYCLKSTKLRDEMLETEKKYPLAVPAASAELVRIFRNYIVHGGEPYLSEDYIASIRLYAVTRLLLILIQYLAIRKLRRPIEEVALSACLEEVGKEPARKYLEYLHYSDQIWRSEDREEFNENGCRNVRFFPMDRV